MACLHFPPKLLETNGHFKGAVPLIISINWPLFFDGKKIKFKTFFKEKNVRQKLTFKNKSQKTRELMTFEAYFRVLVLIEIINIICYLVILKVRN